MFVKNLNSKKYGYIPSYAQLMAAKNDFISINEKSQNCKIYFKFKNQNYVIF